MTILLATQSVASYLDALASSQPTPGGGAAAALTGAQGAALLCMVCHLTLGQRRFVAHANELTSLLVTLEQQRQLLLQLAQQDTEVFQQVISAYKLPKTDAAGLTHRAAAIQLALKAAAEVPLQVFQLCNAILPIVEKLATIGNPAVGSDVTVARHLLLATALSAKANVEVNLTGITDQEFCQITRDVMALR